MAILILVAVVLSATALFIVSRHRLNADLRALSPEDQKRRIDILGADKFLKAAQHSYDTAIGVAAKQLSAAQPPAVLARCGPAVLTETSIILNGRPRPLTPGIRVDVDASGDVQKYGTSRTTATRVVTGALLFGPVGAIVGGSAKKTQVHTQDTRQLYLIVTGPDWQEVVQANPQLATAARQFAAAVYSHSSHIAQLAQQFQMRAAQGVRLHQMAIANTGPLEAARQARSVLELDPLTELRAARTAAKTEAKLARKQISPAK